ncbi:TPA: response regulator transcription factor [Candidatus Scatousia excrementigallinarum]|uniref:Response regulator transcription factor n=1 Tax=Candidatus Scatousia excrementigallinarum TaxID=2840935 RepID=A0A9D1JNW2_9BACT|nr:response regulator transcription factor [Candidatus Scatousia excrementigallinarum]
MSITPIRILLVEDHKLMRVGLKSLFEEHKELEVISEAQSGKEAIENYKISHPDVVLMDIGLPDMSGIEATKKIIENSSNAKIIILTSHLSEQEVMDALHAGACAYVMKDINIEILKMIIRTVKDGAMWLDPQAVPILREKNCGVIPPRQMSRAMFKEQHANLTQREYEVLKLVVDGKSNNEIAQELTISEHTAKAHVCNIIQKLVVDDRTQAAVKALKEGLV